MSKIIEALRRTPARPAEPSAAAPAARAAHDREIQVESQNREWTRERLADVYFSAVGKPKTSEPPIIIKVVEKPRWAAAMPWIITTVAFLITAVALFSTKRLVFDVRVIDDKTFLLSSDEMPAHPAAAESADAADSSESIPLESFAFEGAAMLQSSKDARRLTLVNSSVSPFARAVLRPEKGLDLSKAKLVFDVRGGKGGEKLGVAIKDRGNNQAFKKGVVQLFPDGLGTEWTQAQILLVDLNEDFNPKQVSTVRFEFGVKDTANRSGDTIYVRGLRLVPLA